MLRDLQSGGDGPLLATDELSLKDKFVAAQNTSAPHAVNARALTFAKAQIQTDTSLADDDTTSWPRHTRRRPPPFTPTKSSWPITLACSALVAAMEVGKILAALG